ncbi:MAG TPA: LysM peptidoglycan-binding domain-containing protein [Anaeromyxobacter sp.]|nr:LysM peptidoglycan-binding domain-containing protein [Anaeromyxobacter sp.]
MHNASTKQRLSALRRKFGIFTGWQPRWVKDRRRRLGPSAAGWTFAPGSFAPVDEAPTEVASPPPVETESVAAALAETESVASPPPETESVAPPPAETESVAAPQAETESVAAPPAAAVSVPARTPRAVAVPGAQPTAAVVPPAHRPGTVPARSACASVLVAPARRRDGRAARGAAVALAVVALAATILALGRRGLEAPAGPEGVERAAGHGAVAIAPAAASSPVAASAGAPDPSLVEVQRGDTLWRLAAVHLGDPMRWPELHAANARAIRDPDLIFPGQRLEVPQSAQL